MNELPKRKNLRVYNYDYSQSGYYFITICTKNKKKILCQISQNNIQFYNKGKFVYDYFKMLENFYKVKFPIYVVMPNHVHFILEIQKDNFNNINVPKIVSSFKKFTNKYTNSKIWQRNYYEHIIRNENEFLEIYKYIKNNPLKWMYDKYF